MSSASVSVFFPARSRRKQGEGSVSSVPVQSRAEQLCCMRTSGATLDPWHASGVIGGAPHHVAARTLSTSQHEPPCAIALPPPAVPAPPSAPRQRLGCTCGEQSRRHNTRPAQHGRTQQHELGPGSFPTQKHARSYHFGARRLRAMDASNGIAGATWPASGATPGGVDCLDSRLRGAVRGEERLEESGRDSGRDWRLSLAADRGVGTITAAAGPSSVPSSCSLGLDESTNGGLTLGGGGGGVGDSSAGGGDRLGAEAGTAPTTGGGMSTTPLMRTRLGVGRSCDSRWCSFVGEYDRTLAVGLLPSSLSLVGTVPAPGSLVDFTDSTPAGGVAGFAVRGVGAVPAWVKPGDAASGLAGLSSVCHPAGEPGTGDIAGPCDASPPVEVGRPPLVDGPRPL